MTRRTRAIALPHFWPIALMALLIAGYLLATLPYLSDFPVLEWGQMRILAPAHQLATQGVYGNDLLTGFFNAERRGYEFLPLYPLQIALAFKLLGVGVFQARLVSVLGGLFALALTYRLGRQLYGATLGALAASALVLLRLGLPVPGEADRLGVDLNASGIPLLDLSRLIRFDIWVPAWVLAASLVFLWAYPRSLRWGLLCAGLLAGLASLTHLYGGFILAVFGLLVVWDHGWRALRRPALYLLGAGWLLALLPWVLYALADLPAFRGQTLRQAANFSLLQPGFYLDNLLREPWRYLAWFGGGFRHPILWPRAGIWLLLAGLIVSTVLLLGRIWRGRRLADRFLLLALPVLAALLAVLVAYKRYYYVLLVLPFLALQVAFAVEAVWRDARWRPGLLRAALVLALLLVAAEGLFGTVRSLQLARATTPYRNVTDAISAVLPPGARLLLADPYWLGLRAYPARSLQLAFLLSDSRYYAHPPSVAQALAALRPDYIVAEERLLDLYAPEAGSPPAPRPEWAELNGYLAAHCPSIVAVVESADYGRVRVSRCASGQGR